MQCLLIQHSLTSTSVASLATRQRIVHVATELGVDGRQRRHERAFRVRPHVIRQFKKYPPAIQAVMDKLRREGFQVVPYNSPQPSTPNRVRTSLKMILVNGALCTIQVRPAFKFRPNGREYARLDVGRDIKRAKAALFAVCKRPHNETRRHSPNSFAKDFVCIYSC
jgi:hypothetical protein